MVKEGIVLSHKISKSGIEVDRAKIDVIAKLPYPTNMKGVRSFLGHAGFYRRFIKDFFKIVRPMTQLLMKDAIFIFSNECMQAFNILKNKLTSAPVIIAPDWNPDFELMCDASDYAVGAVLGQRIDKKFRSIYYARSRWIHKKSACIGVRNVGGKELQEILEHCHMRPTRGHYRADITARKVFESGFYWPTIFRNAARYIRDCDACQRAELRNEAYEHSRAYKERTKRWHDAKIMDKEFHEGDEVLIFNLRLKLFPGKLKSRWYGPYTISKVFPYGTVKVCGSIYKEVEFEVSSTHFHVEARFCLGLISREKRLFYKCYARSHLLQLSLEEESNAQGSLLF
ncbi:reverse transcriptase domain-containing protein [Tanacetum coccineum]